MKIKQMIITLFVFLSFIPLCVLGYTNMVYNNGKLEKLLENDLRVAVSTQVRSIENFFTERRAEQAVFCNLESVKELLRHRDADQAKVDKSLAELLRVRAETSDFLHRISITDTGYHVVASSDGSTELDDGLKELDASFFQKDLQFTHVISSGGDSQRKYIAATQAVVDDGRITGYVILEVNLDFFEGIRASAELFNNGTVYIVDDQGQIISAGDTVSTRGQYVLSASEREDYLRAYRERDPEEKIGILRYKARGQHYMSCYMVLDDLEWKVISSINVDQVLGYQRTFVDFVALIAGSLGILLLIVNYLVRRYFAVPINNMIGRFQQIKTTGDYSIRMDHIGENEIGVISREVNSLLESVESYLNQQSKEQDYLRRKAEQDLMTGLYNKETMGTLLREELERIKADRVPVACLFIDIDDFKDFNTKHGHTGGDQVLRFVASTLKSNFPGIAGRHGGDEFIVVISGEEKVKDLERCIEDVLRVLNRGTILDNGGEHASVKCSIGAVIVPDGNISYEELIERSDQAMYEVKHNHKNGYLIQCV